MIKKCPICDRQFETNTKQKYCSDACKVAGVRILKTKYAMKQKHLAFSEDKTATKIEPIQNAATLWNTQNPVASYVQNNEHIDYITKSINACKELDAAHQKVQDIIDVLKLEQAKYNKEDYEFSHSVEGSAYLTDAQKLEIWNEYQKARSKRRNVKDVIRVLISLVKYIPNNSEQLLKDAIQGKVKLDDFYNDFYKQRSGGGGR